MPPLPEWRYAYTESGEAPLAQGRLRSAEDDFRVDESLGFTPSGDGEHDLIRVEKVGLTTERAASVLARHAGVPRRDVGYSGMKDRRAVTTQWFSVRRLPRRSTDWQALGEAGLRVLDAAPHRRKLKRGSHRANRFRLVVRDIEDRDDTIETRLRRIRDSGFPNYFGEQRFGRCAGNLDSAAALFEGRRLSRQRRSLAISAARALIFNEILSARIAAGSWHRLIAGDVANLDGTRSVFDVSEPDATLEDRAAKLDLHPTGPLWGAGAPGTSADAGVLEADIAGRHPVFADGLARIAKSARRPLRARAVGLDWAFSQSSLSLSFELGRGSYATALVRELVVTPTAV